MKKKLLLLITCFFLYSTITIFLYSQDRKPSSKITNNEEKDRIEVIINENDYFFARSSGQITENIIFFISVGTLLFIWENDKNIDYFSPCDEGGNLEERIKILNNACCGNEDSHGAGLGERQNWFGFATFVSFIVITLFVEFVLNRFLIGSLSHLLSKDKNKRYFHTLKMSWKKRTFSSFSKTKIFFVVLSYLLYAFVVVLIAKLTKKCFNNGEGIIKNHQSNYCCSCFSSLEKNKAPEEFDQLTPADDPDLINFFAPQT